MYSLACFAIHHYTYHHHHHQVEPVLIFCEVIETTALMQCLKMGSRPLEDLSRHFDPSTRERSRSRASKMRRWDGSCCACGHQLQDLTYRILNCPASKSLRGPFQFYLFFFDLWSDLGAWPDCWVTTVDFFHVPIPRKESR